MSILPVELWEPVDGDVWRPPLNTAGVESFLRDRGLGDGVRVFDGPDIPVDPGTMLVISWRPGTGLSFEGAISSPSFQIRTIGPQNNPEASRELAQRVDAELVLRDAWPSFIGGRYVVEIRRTGGEPAPDRIDDADRAHYVCTYLADVETQ